MHPNAEMTATHRRAKKPRSSIFFIWRGILADHYAMCGALILISVMIAAVFAPWLAPFDPTVSFPRLRLEGLGTPDHILGLDHQGRDMLSRLIWGGRTTLFAGITPVLLSALCAIPLGLVAAWNDRLGSVIMRVMDVLFAFPMVLLAIMLAAFMGPGMLNMIIALTIVLLPYNTRVVYVAAQQERNSSYIEAAIAAATPTPKILFVEMLPNVVAASIVYSTTIVGNIIITAAGLSFLGLGVQAPTAEWGIITSDGRQYLFNAAHISLLPGIAIMAVVIAFNLLGDTLRDALDPKTRLALTSRK
ncbi:ABC transporter permease [Marinobacter psychrophilus]|jgi:peptide/nickel transport system permease protein|uniref:ABC transporter permease n=1 Tax=Marinobacter psychrophilus TaxID=330734 RepID=UPI001B52BD11|nr:ABC transporter permease [Marinobacter psychrophilus]MBQ0764686.1 ABC transporter permease [Marinobacter psychrophilus]MBQ0843354.1 ABC transporter permease [Marinobacter psychrophilus]